MIKLNKENIRLKDIAEILNCSISTVSKALKNDSEISDSVRKKVHSISENYGYSPNFFAKNLKNKNCKVIRVSKSNKNDLRFLKKFLCGAELTLIENSASPGFKDTNTSPKEILKDDSVDIYLVIDGKGYKGTKLSRMSTIESEK
ncbi:LacI family DNA-binding transcriptional regulator [uncultured Croceitalea sp.]|uniref:LacI family DNA-binding transcriptional regulator n=1 Tax=uncultured Croceitalea sp. TaxID=1798908 RepID=UPI00374ECF12